MIGAPLPDSIRSMATPRMLAWIKPWMVVVSLTAIAAGGATAVYFAGEAQHRRDRADIIAWQARALPAAIDASMVRVRLSSTMSLPSIIAARSELQRDLDSLTAPPIPEIVRPTLSAYEEAIRRTEAALEAAGTPSFAEALRRAGAAFALAKTTEHALVCRARLPACTKP
jgi:hypothetical protein